MNLILYLDVFTSRILAQFPNAEAQCQSREKLPVHMIFTEVYTSRILAQFPNAEAQCQSREKLPVHMIFTDIVGLSQFKRKVKNGFGKFRY